MAGELARRGRRVTVLDSAPAPFPGPRGNGIQPPDVGGARPPRGHQPARGIGDGTKMAGGGALSLIRLRLAARQPQRLPRPLPLNQLRGALDRRTDPAHRNSQRTAPPGPALN
ncbi:hypothetical protein ACGFMK_42235 [Amycolatopsis sp. NPDC049252]|uniref:hypothetical protein n=1 Tax=Amycolatopsis sp. NPDC049252 TaxID=3363933 RepID=UPI0037234741